MFAAILRGEIDDNLNGGPLINGLSKKKGPASMIAGPFPMLVQHLPLSYDRRGRGRSFSLADVLRTASDAQESEHCGHS
jgi:hypothetical protein